MVPGHRADGTAFLLCLVLVKPDDICLQLVVSGNGRAAGLLQGQCQEGPGHCSWKPSLVRSFPINPEKSLSVYSKGILGFRLLWLE